MNANSQRQAAFKARMRAQGKRQLSLWVTPDQEQLIKTFLAGHASLTGPPPPGHPHQPSSETLPVTLRAASAAKPTAPVADAIAALRDALADGLEPRFKKALLTPHGVGWSILVGPHHVGQVWKAKSGYGWEGHQTLRASLFDALCPHKAKTRHEIAQAVIASLAS